MAIKSGDWFEEEQFWKGLFEFMFPPERFAAAEAEIEKLVKLIDFRGVQVLDLACGPGRHSVCLAKKGYDVTGVDRSAFLLQKAKKYAQESGTQVNWVQSDMREFQSTNSFDLAISLFTSFGYFEKQEDNLLVIRNIYQSLKNGGFFVLDMMGKERIAREYSQSLVHEMRNGTLLLERPKVIDDWSRIENEWILITEQRVQRFHFRHSIYSGQELKTLLNQAGFESVKLYGDFDGTAYGVSSTRLVAVAQKN